LDISTVRRNLTTKRFDVPDQAFRFECASLRPYTRYYLIFDKLDYTDFCVQDGKGLSDPLISDGYGKLNFTFYWGRSNEAAMLDNKLFSRYFDSNVGNKVVTISDKSGTSFINKTIYFTNNSPDIMFSKYTNASTIVLT